MINIPPLHSSKRIEAQVLPAVLKSWQVGQILQSRAQTSSNAEGELLVQIGKHTLPARSNIPLTEGQSLQLQVATLGQTPLLKILGQSSSTDAITLYLRQSLPQPERLQTLLNTIQRLLPQLDTKAETEDFTALRLEFNKLAELVKPSLTINAETIRSTLQNSGLFLENQLQKGQIPQQDIKLRFFQLRQTVEQLLQQTTPGSDSSKAASSESTLTLPRIASLLLTQMPPTGLQQLLSSLPVLPAGLSDSFSLLKDQQQLQNLLQKMTTPQLNQLKQWLQWIPLLSEMRQLLDQSLSTITNQQLQSVQADADSAFLLLFNLLFTKTPDWIDLFKVRIERDSEQKENTLHWSVVIQFEMPELGKMQARLLLKEDQLHTGITSEQLATHKVVEQHLPLLQSALQNAGFNIGTLSCRQDKVADIEQPHIRHALLDDSA